MPNPYFERRQLPGTSDPNYSYLVPEFPEELYESLMGDIRGEAEAGTRRVEQSVAGGVGTTGAGGGRIADILSGRVRAGERLRGGFEQERIGQALIGARGAEGRRRDEIARIKEQNELRKRERSALWGKIIGAGVGAGASLIPGAGPFLGPVASAFTGQPYQPQPTTGGAMSTDDYERLVEMYQQIIESMQEN